MYVTVEKFGVNGDLRKVAEPCPMRHEIHTYDIDKKGSHKRRSHKKRARRRLLRLPCSCTGTPHTPISSNRQHGARGGGASASLTINMFHVKRTVHGATHSDRKDPATVLRTEQRFVFRWGC